MHGIAQGAAITATENMTAVGECGDQGLGGSLDCRNSCSVVPKTGKRTVK
jgi:hypothetical protein